MFNLFSRGVLLYRIYALHIFSFITMDELLPLYDAAKLPNATRRKGIALWKQCSFAQMYGVRRQEENLNQ